MNKIVIASSNPGKIIEFQELLFDCEIEMIAQDQLNIQSIKETATTFVENALLKARHAARASGLPALADDSGLCVDCLQGAPGLYSARYAKEGASSVENIQKLLSQMAQINDGHRGAHFYSVIVLINRFDDPEPFLATGKWSGSITHEMRGENGFGYDPIFFDESHQKTAAELNAIIKNKISHRGQALMQLRQYLSR